jgi:hypothetical protein
MKRNNLYRRGVTLAIGLLLWNLAYAQKKPNIVIIVSDDHAYQAIGAYGSKLMKTPNIDRIARAGVTFKSAYVTNSICGPSRAVILTGKYSHKNGFKDNVSGEFDHSQDNFAKHLQKGGYQTAWIGKLHLGSKLQGFDYYSVVPGQGQYYNPDFIGMDGKTTRRDISLMSLKMQLNNGWMTGTSQNHFVWLSAIRPHTAPGFRILQIWVGLTR